MSGPRNDVSAYPNIPEDDKMAHAKDWEVAYPEVISLK
jgi:hypothetical protein